MDIYGKIAEKIRNIAGRGRVQPVVFTAQVEAVADRTCSIKIDDLIITDVRLRAVINGKNEQILVTPKIGSYVMLADLSGGDYRQLVVIKYSEVEEINIKIGDFSVEVNMAGVTVDSNGENLFKVLSDFITEVSKIIVIQGTSPDVPALTQIKQRLNKILK